MSHVLLEIALEFERLSNSTNPPPPSLTELFAEVRAGHARMAAMFREIDRIVRERQ
jgi:hypothetical protein